MSWYRRLRNALRSERLSDDIDRELTFHVLERADELMANGMSERDALREAERRFGNFTAQKEETRAMDLHGWLDTFLADLRYALRALRGSPSFALVAILSLGLGIGANTAIFSLLDSVMLKPLPVQAPEELVRVTEAGSEFGVFTNPLWEEIRDQQDVFSGAYAYGNARFNLAKSGEVDPVEAAWVSGGFFPTLGVSPAAGRLLGSADDKRGCAPNAVVSHDFWRSRLGGEKSAVGGRISLNSKEFQVIGVAAPNFSGVEIGTATHVYVPLCAHPIINGSDVFLTGRSMWWLRAGGRVKPGLTEEQVRARLAQLSPAIFGATVPTAGSAARRADHVKRTLDVIDGSAGFSMLRRNYSRGLVVLMVVVATVLLIACANVANLLLARATSRQREIAVRLAIGAGRGRIIRQLLTESVVLSFLGAAVGILFAIWGNRLLVSLLSTSSDPIWLDLSLNTRILGFAVATAIFAALLFGLAPAWRATRVDPFAIIKAHTRSIVRGDSRFGLGKALVATQIALSLVLVVAASLLLGTFRELMTTDKGFEPGRVLLVNTNLRYAELTPEQRSSAFRNLLDQTRALPGVKAAGASDITPLSGSSWNEEIDVQGFTKKSEEDVLVWMNQVSEGYFAAMGTRLLQGRDFDSRDVPGSPKVAIITETFARKFFGSTSPLGKTYRTRMGDELGDPVEIIGVVEDAKYNNLREEAQPIGYLAMNQQPGQSNSLNFEIATDGDPNALIPGFKALVAAIHPSATLTFTTLERQVSDSISRERLLATLSGFFGGLALLLATIGLYGVISYNMARRRNEIGIRIALGSARTRIMRLVLGEVGQILIVGLAAGSALALASTRLVASMLYGVTPTDPRIMIASALILGSVALIAGAIPASRAARLDPMVALRED